MPDEVASEILDSEAPGVRPGTLIVAPDAAESRLRVLVRKEGSLAELSVMSIRDLEEVLTSADLTWIDVTGLANTELLQGLAELLGLHPLALEDIGSTSQRPKIETYGEDLLIFARMLKIPRSVEAPNETQQLSIFLRRGLVVTFREQAGGEFDPVRNRLRSPSGRLQSSGADYLAYALLDTIVDHYLLVSRDYEEIIEELEIQVLGEKVDELIEKVHRLRQSLISTRRDIAPLRDVVAQLQRSGPQLSSFEDPTLVFLRDCLDHAIRTVERIDHCRELLKGLLELHLSTLSHQTNQAMQTLTVIATIFIPLSFVAGLYGMNFDTRSPWNMPELAWAYGYPAVLAVMTGVALMLLWYLRRKGWF